MLKKLPILFESGVGSGLLLLFMAVLALVVVNSPWAAYYQAFFGFEVGYVWHGYGLVKPLLLWVNDGLMALFFLMVGLEIKHELIDGELNTLAKASLPLFAALGGMIVPALIYVGITWYDPVARQGWAIPSATDIAFTLAIFAMLRSRIPLALKVLVTALAIMDDLGAIVIIALFYTQELSWLALSLAGLCCLLLFSLNRMRVMAFTPYAIVGMILWFCVLKSGVHATLAGVVLAWAYPYSGKAKMGDRPSIQNRQPAAALEHRLNPWVNYAILPLFAFANAGVVLQGDFVSQLLAPVTLGIALGLFIGKQLGIMLVSWLAVKLRWAAMPQETSWLKFYGAAVLCGIGFTMSLFIGSLAFGDDSEVLTQSVRSGVLLGSMLSGIWGALILRLTAPLSMNR